MIRGKHSIECMPCSSRIINVMLAEIHTKKKCDFLKSVIYCFYFKSLHRYMLANGLYRVYNEWISYGPVSLPASC